jgi:hypothetical protein
LPLELEAHKREVDVPFKDFLHDSEVQSSRTRRDWFDRVLSGLMRGRDG